MSPARGEPVSRLFIALWPPDGVLDELEALPRPEVAKLRWTARRTWHITLRFLGEADPAEAEEALLGLRHEPVDVAVKGRLRRIGRDALMVPVSGVDSLGAAVTDLTASIGLPPGRRFTGHLTLARMKDPRSSGVPPLEVHVEWRAGEVVLVESTLSPGGSDYRTIATFPLIG